MRQNTAYNVLGTPMFMETFSAYRPNNFWLVAIPWEVHYRYLHGYHRIVHKSWRCPSLKPKFHYADFFRDADDKPVTSPRPDTRKSATYSWPSPYVRPFVVTCCARSQIPLKRACRRLVTNFFKPFWHVVMVCIPEISPWHPRYTVNVRSFPVNVISSRNPRDFSEISLRGCHDKSRLCIHCWPCRWRTDFR